MNRLNPVVIISVTSLVVAIMSAALSFFQYANARDQLIVSARPYLVIEQQLSLVPGQLDASGPESRLNLIVPDAPKDFRVGEFLYLVRNLGSGQAILKWAGAGFHGQQIEQYTKAVLEDCKKDKTCRAVPIGYFIGLDEGKGLKPGDAFTLFYLQIRIQDMYAAAALVERFKPLQRKFIYCSIYGECFETCEGFAPEPGFGGNCLTGQVSTVGLFDRLNPVFQYNWGQKPGSSRK